MCGHDYSMYDNGYSVALTHFCNYRMWYRRPCLILQGHSREITLHVVWSIGVQDLIYTLVSSIANGIARVYYENLNCFVLTRCKSIYRYRLG